MIKFSLNSGELIGKKLISEIQSGKKREIVSQGRMPSYEELTNVDTGEK